MRQRPLLLFVSALVFLYLPIELLWQQAHGHHATFLEWLISGACPIFLMFGLIRVTRVGWYTLIAMVFLWGVRDLQNYYFSYGSSTKFLIHIGLYLFSLSYFINPRIRHLYFDPKSRWWRVKKRFETHAPALVNRGTEWQYPILRNVSEGGCFIETTSPLDVSENIQVTIPLSVPLGVSVIKVRGEVRWSSGLGSRPGMGVQFLNPAPEHQKAINEYVRRGL